MDPYSLMDPEAAMMNAAPVTPVLRGTLSADWQLPAYGDEESMAVPNPINFPMPVLPGPHASPLDFIDIAGAWPRDGLEALLSTALDGKSTHDPCEFVQCWSRDLHFKAGLGSAMNNYVNEVLVAMISGVPAVRCGSKAVDRLASIFARRPEKTCDHCLKDSYQQGLFRVGGLASARVRDGGRQDALLAVKRFLYTRLFELTPSMRERVSGVSRSLGLANRSYIGMHIRRGDKYRETSPVDLDDYIKAAKEAAINRTETTLVFLASDDAHVRRELQSALGGAFQVAEQPRQSDSTYRKRGVQYSLDETTQFFTDMTLLVGSHVFIGTATSNVGRFVYFQREPTLRSVSLARDWLDISM